MQYKYVIISAQDSNYWILRFTSTSYIAFSFNKNGCNIVFCFNILKMHYIDSCVILNKSL